MINKNEYIKSMSEAIGSCPPATQDVTLNLKNRQDCIDKANYGPANPNEQDEAYWQKKADQFKTTIKIAKTMRCKNCAAFIKKPSIMDCIEKGLAAEEEFATDIIEAANLGYCELFDFKCAGDRTCDAWIVNGPIL